MTPEIRPASDEEIVKIGAWNCDCSTKGPNHPWQCLMVFGPRLIARIDADRARIAELEADGDVYLTLNAEANRTIARQAEEIERLKSQLANCQASSEEIRATAKERTR